MIRFTSKPNFNLALSFVWKFYTKIGDNTLFKNTVNSKQDCYMYSPSERVFKCSFGVTVYMPVPSAGLDFKNLVFRMRIRHIFAAFVRINADYFSSLLVMLWPPLWSSGQSFWLQIQRSRVRFSALPDFLSSSGSGTGSTQPHEVNWGATWIKSSGSGPENRD